MSQIGTKVTASSLGAVLTLTGNSGGAVPPTAGNINVVGSGIISVAGNPGTSTLTISATGEILSIVGDNAGATSASTINITANESATLGSSVFNVTGGNLISLIFSDASNNMCIGTSPVNPAGSANTALGVGAMANIAASFSNTAIGLSALQLLTAGSFNTVVGENSLASLHTGSYNTTLGYLAGNSYATAESSNICIRNTGTATESNVIRIGTTGSSNGQQNKCFIAGITGVNVGSVASVVSLSGDQLGSTTITAGAGITVTPGANTITIASTGGVTWINVSGTSASMAVNTGYIANNAGLVTLTLPTTAAQGSIIRVAGQGAGGWTIVQNTGQLINDGSAPTTITTGSLSSTNQFDTVELLCTVADTTFNVLSSQGNLTVL